MNVFIIMKLNKMGLKFLDFRRKGQIYLFLFLGNFWKGFWPYKTKYQTLKCLQWILAQNSVMYFFVAFLGLSFWMNGDWHYLVVVINVSTNKTNILDFFHFLWLPNEK